MSRPHLSLYSFFHLNLAFSSIEEELRPEVIRRCYWPLLHLAREQRIPLGIETSGYTLEVISELDPTWTEELRRLCQEGTTEFIGSGYSQIIGPLVPSPVNAANQRLGLETYERILGFRPPLALVNEQAYSAGMVGHYREAGYRGIITEWDNPASAHPEWDPGWRYLPQYACGPDGARLPVIWNKSIPFQKFQRYAHGEMELPDYLDFVRGKVGAGERVFALYGNDAEIFDFRPGRFQTEAVIGNESEWTRIARLYEALRRDDRFALILPGQVLDFLGCPGAGHQLRLESASQPVPVKKQAKYNVMRWALTGRDDLGLNTACWQLFEELVRRPEAAEADWKELCYLWSSDFRTHITARRWQGVQDRLTAFQRRLQRTVVSAERLSPDPDVTCAFQVQMDGAFLEIDTPYQRLRLNCRRGMVVDSWWDKALSDKPLVRTLPHGYFDDIGFGADFYTGHFVLEIPGQHKITDLLPVSPVWEVKDGGLVVRAVIQTSLGPVFKEVAVSGVGSGFEIAHQFRWPTCPLGTLRIGHITLNPEVFAQGSLSYHSHNGSETVETFSINEPINHLAPVSTLVSASHGLGMTSGMVELGDAVRRVRVEVGKAAAALTGHVVYSPVAGEYFFRLVLSAMEMDDTACHAKDRRVFSDLIVRLRLSGSASSAPSF